jgi:hypothetical protein
MVAVAAVVSRYGAAVRGGRCGLSSYKVHGDVAHPAMRCMAMWRV